MFGCVVHIHRVRQSPLLGVAQAGPLLSFIFALASAGKSIAARIAIIAITTSNSINLKPRFCPLFHTSNLVLHTASTTWISL